MGHIRGPDFPEYWYIPKMHMVSIVLYIFHGPIRVISEDYNIFLDLALHEVLRLSQNITMQETFHSCV